MINTVLSIIITVYLSIDPIFSHYANCVLNIQKVVTEVSVGEKCNIEHVDLSFRWFLSPTRIYCGPW